MKTEGKKVLLLGGVNQNLNMVHTAHKMGVTVYVTDYLKDSPCKKIADKAFDVDATDVDGVVKLIKEEHIDGVVTGYVDVLLPYYAEICRKAGLPSYAAKEQFDRIVDKAMLKEACIKCGVPVPHSYTESDIEADNIDYPVIVKPVDGSGSKGCSVCYDKEQVKHAIRDALSFSKKGEYLVEEFMTEGKILIQYFLQDGNPVMLSVADIYYEDIYPDRPDVAVCNIHPSKYTRYFMDVLYPRYKELFDYLGLKDGPMHIEAYIKNGEIYCGDIGYRLGGGRVHYLTAYAFGIDFYELLINFALTGKVSDKNIAELCDPYLSGKYGAQVNYCLRPGKVHKITVAEKPEDIPGVFYASIFIKEGFELKDEDRGKLIQTVGRIRVLADTVEELEQAMYRIFNAMDFLDENGESLKLNTANYDEYLKSYLQKIDA